ncbi:uncharacterized protein LOC111272724 [Varroa jacobsoni]|uniref:uncharacterized protein LOC111272724 n=1 Tax=Varroa jacobsoni TaxID=62625 RepID=UPI000BF555CE|nr:uncharacterized protein LOC111272724 [Varroa jacobsoni]
MLFDLLATQRHVRQPPWTYGNRKFIGCYDSTLRTSVGEARLLSHVRANVIRNADQELQAIVCPRLDMQSANNCPIVPPPDPHNRPECRCPPFYKRCPGPCYQNFCLGPAGPADMVHCNHFTAV